MRLVKFLGAVSVVAIAAAASPALAQDTSGQNGAVQAAVDPGTVQGQNVGTPGATEPGQTTGGQATDSSKLQDIVVTATRQAENLQKVSAAVQVIDGSKITQQGLADVQQILSDIPGVQVTGQAAGYNVDIRGQAADMQASSGQGAVALEFDGIYNIQSQATTIGFFDVDRIEVLPGPQSTRYGPNAKGGVVNVITRDPILGSWNGQANVTVGNYNLVRVEVAQDIPIGDTLALRVSGATISRGSYFTPATSNAEAQSIRGKLLFQPNDRLTVSAQVQYDHIGGTGKGAEAGRPFAVSYVLPYSGASINDTSNPWAQGNYSTNDVRPSDSRANLKQYTFIGRIGYQIGDWAAVDVTQSYIKESGTQYNCYPSNGTTRGSDYRCQTDYPLEPFNQYSTEVRFHNQAGSALKWNLGYYHWNYNIASYTTVVDPSGKSASSTSTNALFADVTVPLTDRLRGIAGARMSWDDRTLVPGSGIETQFRAKFHNFDYRVGEEFDVAPRVMQYFTITTAYSPGVLSYDGPTQSAYVSPNQRLTSFEFGLKSRLFNDMLQLNGDAFYYIQKNYLFQNGYSNFTLPSGFVCSADLNPTPAQCGIANSPVDAQTYGVEGQIRFKPTRRDEFSFSLAWLHARVDSDVTACNTFGLPADYGPGCWLGYNAVHGDPTAPIYFFNAAGGPLDHSPNFQGNFSYTHTFELPGGFRLAATGAAFHSTGFYDLQIIDVLNNNFQPGYWQYNASAVLTPSSRNWSLSAYVRNISNYAVKISTAPQTTISDPRTYGLTLHLNW